MRLFAAVMFAVVLASPAVHAQAGPVAWVRAGVARRHAGDDAGAFALFARAYALAPTPPNTAELGLVELALGRWIDAERHLRAALAASDDAWIAMHRHELEGAYALALAHVPRATHDELRTGAGNDHGATRAGMERRRETLPVRTLAWSATVAASVLAAGGFAAWIAREATVRDFNARGCRIGDPNVDPTCDVNATRAARDLFTGLTVAGLVAGAALGATGLALFLHAHLARAERRATASWMIVPEARGASGVISF